MTNKQREELRREENSAANAARRDRQRTRQIRAVACRAVGLSFGPCETSRERAAEFMTIDAPASGQISAALFETTRVVPVEYVVTKNKSVLVHAL